MQMFVTINAKHTPERLASGKPVGQATVQDEALAAAHDAVRALNDREDSPLHGEIKLSGSDAGASRRRRSRRSSRSCQRRIRRTQEIRRFSRRLPKVLRELLQAGGGRVRRGVEWPQIQHQVRNRPARSSACRPMSSADSTRTMPSEVIFVQLAESLRRGGAHRRPALRDEGAWKRSGCDRGQPGTGTQACVGISGRGGGLRKNRKGRMRPVLLRRPGSPSVYGVLP